MKSKLYRAAAGLVGVGCVLVLLHMIMNWKGFTLGVAFAIANLAIVLGFCSITRCASRRRQNLRACLIKRRRTLHDVCSPRQCAAINR